MPDFVAVQPLRFVTRESLKRALVLYRQIFVPDLGIDHAFVSLDRSLRGDLDWLRVKGRLITLDDLTPEQLSHYHNPPREYVAALALEISHLLKEGKYSPNDLGFSFSLYLARFFALYMNRPKDLIGDDTHWQPRNDVAYPELSEVADIETSFKSANQLGMRFPKLFSLLAKPDKTEGVLRLVVHKIPVPDSSTPFEQILDFTENPDSRGRLAGLKAWIWNAVHSNLSVREIEDKLEHELFLFDQHMRLHRMKHTAGTFETIVIMGAEIVENLVRLKFSNVAKLAFSVRRSQLDLMQAEITSPGQELAYLYRARTKFGKPVVRGSA